MTAAALYANRGSLFFPHNYFSQAFAVSQDILISTNKKKENWKTAENYKSKLFFWVPCSGKKSWSISLASWENDFLNRKRDIPRYKKMGKMNLIMAGRTSLVAQMVKHLPTMRETQVQSLGQKDPLEKEMATHSSTLVWKIPWTEEPGRLQFMG